jgi:hypothetical protein
MFQQWSKYLAPWCASRDILKIVEVTYPVPCRSAGAPHRDPIDNSAAALEVGAELLPVDVGLARPAPNLEGTKKVNRKIQASA